MIFFLPTPRKNNKIFRHPSYEVILASNFNSPPFPRPRPGEGAAQVCAQGRCYHGEDGVQDDGPGRHGAEDTRQEVQVPRPVHRRRQDHRAQHVHCLWRWVAAHSVLNFIYLN